jgi:hypothetical protein
MPMVNVALPNWAALDLVVVHGCTALLKLPVKTIPKSQS